MAGKSWIAGALLALMSLSCGCCHWADRWCNNNRTAAAAPAACCCVPCAPGTVTNAPPVPTTGWNQPAGGFSCVCNPAPGAH